MQSGSAQRQIARAAVILMAAFVLAKLTGLAANLLLVRSFGVSGEVDAYLAANRVSETLFNLVAGGALASAFIPIFTTLLARDETEPAWQLASAVANLVLLTLTSLAVLGMIFAPWVVRNLLASGFTDAGQHQLAVRLLRIQLPSAVIFGLSGLVMGILNAHQKFLFPALAPAFYPLGMIAGILLLGPRLGIAGAAWGVVIGSILHLLVQLPQLLRLPRIAYRPAIGRGNAQVREVLLLMGPRLLGVAVVQINFWINTLIASHLEPGSITAIQIGFMLMLMPQAVIAQSIATAALPTFSAQVARGERAEMRAALAASLRGVLLLSIPATVGLILLREPLITLLYQSELLTPRSIAMVSWALLWYTAGLVGHCVVEIISRSFYALHDTRTPVLVGVGAMTLNILLSLLLTRLFDTLGWMPHGGLALANSLATGLEAVVLLVLMRRRLEGLHGADVLRAALGGLAASAGMGAVIWLLLRGGTNLPRGVLVLAGLALGAGVFAAGLVALRMREVQMVWNGLNRLLHRR